MWNRGHFEIMRDSPQIMKLNDKLQSTLADGYADAHGQMLPPLPFRSTVSLSWVTPSSRFQVCNVMKIHVLLGCVVGHPSSPAFPRCARFKGKAMDDVSVDAVSPPAGPAPGSGSIPTPSLLEKGGEIWSVANREACPTCPAQVLGPSSLEREGGSSLGHLCHLCLVRSDLHRGQDPHRAAGKSVIVCRATSPPSHCPCLLQREIPSAALQMLLYISQMLIACVYMDTYCVAKTNRGR